jgi:hypothetical protein
MQVNVLFEYFHGLYSCQTCNIWEQGVKLKLRTSVPKGSGYKRSNDIKEVDIMEFRV